MYIRNSQLKGSSFLGAHFFKLLFVFACEHNVNFNTTMKCFKYSLGPWDNKPITLTYFRYVLTKYLSIWLGCKSFVCKILSIVSINDTLTLLVEGVNETPTLFKFTSQTDSSFVAENPAHDFPTKITYWLENKELKAHVSNSEFGIDFVFEKIN